MSTDTPTPRTDAESEKIPSYNWSSETYQMTQFARKLEKENIRLREALEAIATWDDMGANQHLAYHNSYALFDEPGSVQVAREALANTPEGSNPETKQRAGEKPAIDWTKHWPLLEGEERAG